MTTTALALELGLDRPSILGGGCGDDPASHGHAPHDDRFSVLSGQD